MDVTSDYSGINLTYNQYANEESNVVIEYNVPMITINCIALLIGCFGNALVILSFVKNSELQNMSTTFLLGMSIIHSLSLIFVCLVKIVMELNKRSWILGEFVCKTLPFSIVSVSIFTTGTLSVICLYILMSVVFPGGARIIFGSVNTGIGPAFVGAAFGLSCLVALPQLFWMGTIQAGVKRTVCIGNFHKTAIDVFTFGRIAILIAAAIFTMTTYGVVYNRLRSLQHGYSNNIIISYLFSIEASRKTPDEHIEPDADTSGIKSRKQTIPDKNSTVTRQELKMMWTISVLHVVMQLPQLILFGVFALYEPVYNFRYIVIVFKVCEVLVLLNYCIYPIVYGLMSQDFRKCYKNIICCCIGK